MQVTLTTLGDNGLPLTEELISLEGEDEKTFKSSSPLERGELIARKQQEIYDILVSNLH